MSLQSLIKQYLLENYSPQDQIIVDQEIYKKFTAMKTPPKIDTISAPKKPYPKPPVEALIEKAPKQDHSFQLSSKESPKCDTSSALEKLKKAYPNGRFEESTPKCLPIALVTNQEERQKLETLFSNITAAISGKIAPCQIYCYDIEERFKELNAKIESASLCLVLGTKGALRHYPNIKTLYSEGKIGPVPLIFIDGVEGNKEKKRQLWEQIQSIAQSY